ncbi:hypothetical protein GGH93_000369 [Coemansia aciculifera]|nr:hypothetical protein GGH93_000369 [Coemansia aciculifera]
MTTLESKTFDGAGDFDRWAKATMNIIKYRGAIDALITDITNAKLPEDKNERRDEIDRIEHIEGIAHTLLCLSLAPELGVLGDKRSAYELWNELHSSYSIPDTVNVMRELRILMGTRMKNSEIDGRAFISRFQQHMDSILATGPTVEQILAVMPLLSLNSHYDSVVAKFTAMKLSEFSFKDVQNAIKLQSDAIVYRVPKTDDSFTAGSKRGNRFCAHCKTATHNTGNCRTKRAKDKRNDKASGLPNFELGDTAVHSVHDLANLMGNQDVWLLGSGATASFCHSYSAFLSYKAEEGQITTMGGEVLPVCGRGSVALGDSIQIDNVLHVPGSVVNVLSVSRLAV